jgi:hypothetical protein
MTPMEFDFLKTFLKTRSGLVLSNDKQYLVESRLLPIARSSKLETLSALIQSLQKGGNRALETEVVEAMTTNESFFFRDKTPFEHFKETMLPAMLAKPCHTQTDENLVRGGVDRPGTLFARDLPERGGGKSRRLAHSDPGNRPLAGSAGKGENWTV